MTTKEKQILKAFLIVLCVLALLGSACVIVGLILNLWNANCIDAGMSFCAFAIIGTLAYVILDSITQ